MIRFCTATNGKTTKSVKNPTSTRSRLNILKFLSAFALVMLLGVGNVWGQISIPSSTSVTENFTIGNSATASLPTNWKMSAAGTGSSSLSYAAVGNVTATTAQASSGSSSTGARYNWGNGTTTTDRAIGFMTSGGYASPNSIMAFYRNTSGVQIDDITIAFDFERYRINITTVSVTFYTSTNGTSWTARASGDIATSVFATGSSAYNFTTGTVANRSVSLTGVNIANNGDFYVMWLVTNTGGSNSQGIGLDNVSLTATLASATPSIALSSPSQITAANVNQGTISHILSNFQAAVTTANATLNSIAVVTGGTYTTSSHVSSYKLMYNGTSNTYGSAVQIGSTQSSVASAGTVTFGSLSQSITSGNTGYFWVTADISGSATAAQTVNIAASPTLTFASGSPTGSISAGGAQTFVAVTPNIVLSSPASSTANFTVGTTNNELYRFDLAVTTANATLNGITITTAGTYVASDLTNLKCWYSADAIFNAGSDVLLSTKTTSLGVGTQIFPTFTSQAISSGTTGYIFITTDIPLTATPANTISVNSIATGDITFTSGNKSGTANASGTKTIIDCTPTNVTSPAASSANLSSVLTWANPACFDEIMIVAATAANTGTPAGNGSAYTSNLAYGSGTALGNGFVVYKGATSSQTVTGLTNGTPYFYKYFTRRGTTWSSGTEVSATPNIAGYYWNGASIAANPSAGGTGTWGTANSWRQPSSSGSQATWADNNNAIFGGTAGTVTIEANKTVTTCYVNTTNYVFTPDLTTTRFITGSTSLSSNVVLNINDITATDNRTLTFSGDVGGASGASLNVNVNQTTGSTSRINLGASGATLSIPITVTAGANNVTYGNMAVVGTSTGTILTSAATITNNTNYKSSIGATSGNDITVNSVVSGSSDLMFAAGSSGGAGTVTLGAANTYTGATIFNATNSGVIRLGVANALPTGTNVTMANSSSNGGIFDLNGFNQTIASLTSGVGGGSIINNGATDATLTISGSTSPAAFALVIADGTTNKTLLTRAGTGTLTLSGANTYTGATTINAGTLQLAGGNVGSVGAITSSPIGTSTLNLNGGTLSSNSATARTVLNVTAIGGDITLGNATNTGALSFSAATTISGATRTLTTASAVTFAGAIGDGGNAYGITKAGSGTLSLTAANTYTGLTTISGGTLQLNAGADNTIPATNNVTINGGTLQISKSQTLNNLTLTSGNLTVDVGDVLTINGTLTISGGTITNNGTITFGGSSTLVYNTSDTRTASTEWPSLSPPTNITIQGGSIVTLPGNRTINNLTLTSGALAIGANTLTLSDAVSGGATMTGGATSNLTIGGAAGTLSFSSGARTLQNLVIGTGSNASLTLGSALDIAPTGGITFNAAGTKSFTTTGQTLTLKSTAAGTAYIGNINGATITGNITAERFISSQGRRWRFLASPFTNATFEDLRQEIYLSGAGSGNTAGSLNSNGFDATLSNQPSVFSYNEPASGNLNQGWVGLTNSTSSLSNQPIVAGKGYRIFVRGDRSDIGRLTGTNTIQNAVTTNLTGTINTGNITMPVTYTASSQQANDGWNLVGNPYPCAFDWNAFRDNNVGITNMDSTIYILDATSGSYKSYNSNSGGSLTDGIIPQGASFWVKANAASPALTLTEQFKTTALPIALFKQTTVDELTLVLTKDSITSDIFILAHYAASTTLKDAFDITKLAGEINIMSKGNDGIDLTYDARPILTINDTVNLFVSGGNKTYTITLKSLPTSNGKHYYLVDKKLASTTLLTTNYSYTYTTSSSDSSSFGNRFQLIISSSSALPVLFKQFTATKQQHTVLLNWTTASEMNNNYFDAEKSIDGKNWQTVSTIKAAGNSNITKHYQAVDEFPNKQTVTYYRIKQVDYDNHISYTQVQPVSFVTENTMDMQLQPNPATDRVDIVTTTPIQKVVITDCNGKQVMEINQPHFTITTLPTGMYVVKITAINGAIVYQKLIKK